MDSKDISKNEWFMFINRINESSGEVPKLPSPRKQPSHAMKLPAEDRILFGTYPATACLVLATCKYCHLRIHSQFLKEHIERSHGFSSRSNDSNSSLQPFDLFVQSEIETSSSNSSPLWESDRNIYDNNYSMSSSSSNSVNIVRLKQEKLKDEPKNNVIPVEFLLGGSYRTQSENNFKPNENKLEPGTMRRELKCAKPQIINSKQKLVYAKQNPIQMKGSGLLSQQPTVALPKTPVISASCTNKAETMFQRRSFFETIQPSTSFVTSVEDSSSESDKKTPKLIIRRVPSQNPKDLKKLSITKGIKEDPHTSDKRQYFLVAKEHNRPQNIKNSRHQIKKKINEVVGENKSQAEEQAEYLRASELQIATLTRRIETLNRQIETLTGQVQPLRLENEEYKSEIRNLRGRVEELESNTNSLIEQRELREKNDQIIEELQQKWEHERFHFIQRLEELQTELSDYKNNSTVEKQKLSYINIILEKKYGLQVALTANLQDEKEILQRHLPPGVQYSLSRNELAEIQRQRAIICTLLNVSEACPVNDPPAASFASAAVEQIPLNNSQVIDVNAYLPVVSQSAEISAGNNEQLLTVFNLSDNKIQYRNFPPEATSDRGEMFESMKEEESDDEEEKDTS